MFSAQVSGYCGRVIRVASNPLAYPTHSLIIYVRITFLEIFGQLENFEQRQVNTKCIIYKLPFLLLFFFFFSSSSLTTSIKVSYPSSLDEKSLL
jgi:hypothetical protein